MTAQTIVATLIAAGVTSVTVADVAVLAAALKAAREHEIIDMLMFGIKGTR